MLTQTYAMQSTFTSRLSRRRPARRTSATRRFPQPAHYTFVAPLAYCIYMYLVSIPILVASHKFILLCCEQIVELDLPPTWRLDPAPRSNRLTPVSPQPLWLTAEAIAREISLERVALGWTIRPPSVPSHTVALMMEAFGEGQYSCNGFRVGRSFTEWTENISSGQKAPRRRGRFRRTIIGIFVGEKSDPKL